MNFIIKEYHLGIKYCLIHRNKFFTGKKQETYQKTYLLKYKTYIIIRTI